MVTKARHLTLSALGGGLSADEQDECDCSFAPAQRRTKGQPYRQKRGTEASRLTSLVCGDVDRNVLWGERALAGDSVDGLDVKGVGRVGPQAADGDAALGQAQLLRHELHVVVASGTAAAVCPALLTDNVVGHILPPTCLSGGVPLQNDGRLVDDGDDVSGT